MQQILEQTTPVLSKRGFEVEITENVKENPKNSPQHLVIQILSCRLLRFSNVFGLRLVENT